MPETQRSREEALEDIKTHPEQHRHTFDGLHQCCTLNGAIDMSLMEAHERYASLGMNGGRRCDVTSGPCSCGGWH